MHLLFTLALLACEPPAELHHFEVKSEPAYQVGDLPVKLTITAVDAGGRTVESFACTAKVEGADILGPEGPQPVTETAPFAAGVAVLSKVVPTDAIAVHIGEVSGNHEVRRIPGFLSIIPPLFAIGMAIALRNALIALFAGIVLGAFFIHDYNPLVALLRTFDTYLPSTIADADHAAIVFFTMALGGMVGIVGRSGGSKALVDVISKRARTRRSGLITTWLSGLVIFFDDYANCLLVGNTLRPFTDRLRISREKLAYIVDSTAAPIATVALVSTWVGYQLGLFGDVLKEQPYELFLGLLPYSFYSFFTMAFVLMLAVSLRDFGPMLTAERRAARGEVLRPGAQPLMDRELTEMEPPELAPVHWLSAVIPVASIIAIVFIGLYVSGSRALADAGVSDPGLRRIISEADAYAVLLWASFGGGVIALITAMAVGSLRFGQAVDAWVAGVKAMLIAVIILVLAWGLGAICQQHLFTGPWVLSNFSPAASWLPVLTFAVCALIAFATGSSFSTMAIVIPIAAPMAWAATGDGSGFDPSTVESIRYATLAAVLSGAVFGDHCSPISDTTIMSSMASASDHMDHVRTQLPYALLCAGVAAVVGFVPAGFGISPLITLPLGLAILAGLVFTLGGRVDQSPDDSSEERVGHLGESGSDEST